MNTASLPLQIITGTERARASRSNVTRSLTLRQWYRRRDCETQPSGPISIRDESPVSVLLGLWERRSDSDFKFATWSSPGPAGRPALVAAQTFAVEAAWAADCRRHAGGPGLFGPFARGRHRSPRGAHPATATATAAGKLGGGGKRRRQARWRQALRQQARRRQVRRRQAQVTRLPRQARPWRAQRRKARRRQARRRQARRWQARRRQAQARQRRERRRLYTGAGGKLGGGERGGGECGGGAAFRCGGKRGNLIFKFMAAARSVQKNSESLKDSVIFFGTERPGTVSGGHTGGTWSA